MRTYENVVEIVANTLTQATVSRSLGFYLSEQQIAFLYNRDPAVVEMDLQMAKELAQKRLTVSWI